MTGIWKTATLSASARYAVLEAGNAGEPSPSTMSRDACHLDRGSPKRNKVMRPRPADEIFDDVQVPPLHLISAVQVPRPPIGSAGKFLRQTPLSAILRVVYA